MEMKSEQTVAEPVKSAEKAVASITRWRHGKRASSKVIASELRGPAWSNGLGGTNIASLTIAHPESGEAYVVKMNYTALAELVRLYNKKQSPENKIGGASE